MARPNRTKETIARDVAFVLNAPLDSFTKKAVLNNAAWAWTMFHGKYDGCPLWSVKAKLYQIAHLQRRIDYEKSDGRTPRPKRSLIHDHAVPRRLVLQMLCDLNPVTPETVFECCEKFLHGVVLTLEEDKSLNASGFRQAMPKEFSEPTSAEFENPWLRFQRCGIQLSPTPPDWPAV
jgi:hypothetical protein